MIITGDASLLNVNLDDLFNRVQSAIEFPWDGVEFEIILFPDQGSLQAEYKCMFGVDVDYIAFTQRKVRKIYLSIEDTTEQVVAHEMCHILTAHLGDSLPYVWHERIAQYGERHI